MVGEITLTIVGEEVASQHPELHHYTTEHGLSGIVESDCLRATNYEDLNDSTEVFHLREALTPELIVRLRALLTRRRVSPRLDRAIRATGGLNKVAADLASDLINSLYGSAFEHEDTSDLSRTAGTPYISSFCTHTRDEYERENGLLSQWRAYGGRTGFCIVFDTAALATMLGAEFDVASYTHLNLAPAHYSTSSTSVTDVFPTLVNCCEELVDGILKDRPVTNNAIMDFFQAATLLKHQAFREEREVRIVAIPLTDRMRALLAEEHPDKSFSPSRSEMSQGVGSKRYLELFRGSGTNLPIKRVIVGPSPAQDAQRANAESLAAGRFAVVASRTPFKG